MHPQLPVRIDAPTERRNPRTLEIDDVPTLDVLRLLNAEDRIPAEAVPRCCPTWPGWWTRRRAGSGRAAGCTTSARAPRAASR